MTSKHQDWRDELKFIVEFMRDLSRQTDPQIAANLYGKRLREGGFLHSDGYLAVSRRDLKHPAYRITRSSTWKEDINPWTDKHRLPTFTTGLLSELVYSNEPAIIENLSERYAPDDPAAEYFRGMKFLLAMPQFDDGQAINMGVILRRDAEGIPREEIPMMVMQSNLWGRSVLSSVLRRELKSAYDALDHELKVVGHIQRSLLPHSLPTIPGLDLAAHYETSQAPAATTMTSSPCPAASGDSSSPMSAVTAFPPPCGWPSPTPSPTPAPTSPCPRRKCLAISTPFSRNATSDEPVRSSPPSTPSTTRRPGN